MSSSLRPRSSVYRRSCVSSSKFWSRQTKVSGTSSRDTVSLNVTPTKFYSRDSQPCLGAPLCLPYFPHLTTSLGSLCTSFTSLLFRSEIFATDHRHPLLLDSKFIPRTVGHKTKLPWYIWTRTPDSQTLSETFVIPDLFQYVLKVIECVGSRSSRYHTRFFYLNCWHRFSLCVACKPPS